MNKSTYAEIRLGNDRWYWRIFIEPSPHRIFPYNYATHETADKAQQAAETYYFQQTENVARNFGGWDSRAWERRKRDWAKHPMEVNPPEPVVRHGSTDGIGLTAGMRDVLYAGVEERW